MLNETFYVIFKHRAPTAKTTKKDQKGRLTFCMLLERKIGKRLLSTTFGIYAIHILD